jgi:hypothetical protein
VPAKKKAVWLGSNGYYHIVGAINHRQFAAIRTILQTKLQL